MPKRYGNSSGMYAPRGGFYFAPNAGLTYGNGIVNGATNAMNTLVKFKQMQMQQQINQMHAQAAMTTANAMANWRQAQASAGSLEGKMALGAQKGDNALQVEKQRGQDWVNRMNAAGDKRIDVAKINAGAKITAADITSSGSQINTITRVLNPSGPFAGTLTPESRAALSARLDSAVQRHAQMVDAYQSQNPSQPQSQPARQGQPSPQQAPQGQPAPQQASPRVVPFEQRSSAQPGDYVPIPDGSGYRKVVAPGHYEKQVYSDQDVQGRSPQSSGQASSLPSVPQLPSRDQVNSGLAQFNAPAIPVSPGAQGQPPVLAAPVMTGGTPGVQSPMDMINPMVPTPMGPASNEIQYPAGS